MYELYAYAYMNDMWVAHSYMHPSNGIKVITKDLCILAGTYEMSHLKKYLSHETNKGFTILEYGKIWCSQNNNNNNNNNTAFWNIFSNMVAGEVYDRMKIL